MVPIFDEFGSVVEMYGRKVQGERLRKGTPLHLYLPGPHRGVFNSEALAASTEVILCESLVDALTFWCAGFRNVVTAYGIQGFTDEMLSAFQSHGTERVLIAYDRDPAGDKAAVKVVETYPMLATNILDRGSAFDLLQNLNDFFFAESALAQCAPPGPMLSF